MSTKRQPNTAERPTETNAPVSNNSSDRVRRNAPAASNTASPQVAQVIMIEEKSLHGNDGTGDSGTPKKLRRRRRDPKAPLQDAGPGRQATASSGNGDGNNKGNTGREKRAPGSGGIRSERGGKKAMASRGKDVATGSVTGAPAPQRSDSKLTTQTTPRTRGNPDISTNMMQHEQRAATVSRNKKIWSDSDATPKRTSKYTGKQSAESTTAAPGSSKPAAPGRMSKTLQRDIEDQRGRKNPKSEDVKANRTATSSSTLAQTAKKGRKPGSRRVSGSGSQIETDNAVSTKTQLKAEEAAEELLDEGKEKPSTKVCIRWLPADLPEHIFWKSVEPALPWFDPEHVGSVTQREREVLCAVTEENNNESDDEIDRNAIEAGSAGESQIAEKESNEEPPSILQALAETKMVMVDVYESNNLAKLDSQPYWRQYSQGKRHRSKAKPDDPSRAYILFADAAEADHFYRHFHGHAFGKKGVINRAMVELAPFQHVFWTLPTPVSAASDPLNGTLDADPHFIAFLKSEASKGKAESDNAPSGESASSSLAPLVAEPQTARISYAAAAASLGKDSGSSGTQGSGSGSRKENKPVTPLIEYLRRIKTTGTARRPPPTQAAKTATASPARPLSSTKASAVNSKAGGKKGASKSTAAPSSTAAAAAAAAAAAPKRPRRRKQ